MTDSHKDTSVKSEDRFDNSMHFKEPRTTASGDTEASSQDAAAKRSSKVRKAATQRKERAKQAALNKTPEKLKNPTDLQVRFRTGFVYVALSVICILVNDVTTAIYLAAVSGVCAGEFYYMLRSDAKLPNESLGIVAAVLYPMASLFFGFPVGTLVVTVGLMLALLVWYVFWMRARIQDVGISFFGAAYTGLLLSGFLLLRGTLDEPWGGVLLLALMMSAWMNDAAAYLVGSRIGRHKLAPRTSPKKSWEGFIAGLGASVLFWCCIKFIPGITMEWWQAIVFGIACGAMGVLGDLAESRIKRNVGAKDSGTIMPGHGGLLDRCDSMFLVSATSAFLLVLGGCIPVGF